MSIDYRPEIDGLRAISVTAVIIYHANFIIFDRLIFQGGLIGVDIFFVISGYLITTLILKELLNTKTFSFLNFYERRIRRILPVLFFVILLCIPFAYFSFLPSSLLSFLKSTIYTLGFSSNFYFFNTGQIYGGEDGLLKPLLHTWSLSIEEQFYILFPFFLLLLFKYFSKYLLKILIVVFFASLLTTQFISIYHPLNNFYFLNVRLWELLAGSIIAYLQLNQANYRIYFSVNLRKYFPVIGLLLIILSIFFLDDKMSLPSFYSVPAILGTCLIILFSNKENIVTKILSIKYLVFIGLISYSLYLWHYPIFAFYRYNFPLVEDSNFKFLIIIIIIFLSIISYNFIEKPFRNRKVININKLTIFLFVQFFLIIFFTVILIYKEKNFNNTIYDKINIDNDVYRTKIEMYAPTKYPLNNFDHKKKNILIVGNSHAIDLFLFFRTNPDLFYNYNFRFTSLESLSNYMDLKDTHFKENISSFRGKYLKSDLFSKIDIILFSNRWSKSNLNDLENLIKLLIKKNKKIILTSHNVNIPSIGKKEITLFDKFITDNKRMPNKKELLILEKEYFDFMINDDKRNRYNNRLTIISKKFNLRLLDKSVYQCDYKQKRCNILTPDGYKINYNAHHHTLEGIKYLGKKVFDLNWLNID